MTATSGIWNRNPISQQSAAVNPMDSSGNDSSSTSTSDSATISSNDFLTLLVTEMQNQDPTATTDPNEYINQLVNVNSLEQLISINQTLSSAIGTSNSATATPDAAGANESTTNSSGIPPAAHNAMRAQPARETSPHGMNPHQVAGNLSVPEASPAAQRVAKSLGGIS